jgi:adenosylcobinamide kinase / adenosylcobinamide-phosphate guanylyltransferase
MRSRGWRAIFWRRGNARGSNPNSSMGQITLITGGARSGKSAHALMLARDAGPRRYFVATAEALDDEMTARIAKHRASRGAEFTTIEVPRDLRAAIESIDKKCDVLVIDCLTLWVSNLMMVGGDDESILRSSGELAAALTRAQCASIIVTDEVGAGIVPDNPAARRFRDLLGWSNQKIADAAERVILMVAGYPIRVK